jgi:hypothetical protein
MPACVHGICTVVRGLPSERQSSAGDLPKVQDDDYRIGYGTVQQRRPATADELASMDLGLLVTSGQDIYHARMRIMRQVRMLARDRSAMLADVKRIFAPCSCSNGHAPFTASSPVELREQVVQLAQQVRRQLLELIPKYSASVTKGSTLRLAVNTVAARLTVQQPVAAATEGGA